MKVQPIVAWVDSPAEFTLCPEELEAIFQVPISLFYDKTAITMHSFEMNNHLVEMPAFRFQEFTIWGLTAAMIVSTLNQVNEEQIKQPEIKFKAIEKSE